MTPLFKKLNYKLHQQIVVIHPPTSFVSELTAMQASTNVITRVEQATDIEFVICFVTTEAELTQFVQSIMDKLKGDAIVWMAYPKMSSKKYTCTFNHDTGFALLGTYGFEPVRQVAIDEDWSGLRFRKVDYIKNITRRESYALTQSAKLRTTQKEK